MRKIIAAISIGFATLVSCTPDHAAESVAQEEAGADLAQRLCSGCHATGVADASKHQSAPPFRSLGAEYPVEYLAEALAEGIIVGHPDMPVFQMTPEQIDAFLDYLRQVQEPVL